VEMWRGGIAGIAWSRAGVLEGLGVCHGLTRPHPGASFIDLDQAVCSIAAVAGMNHNRITKDWNH